MLDDPFRIRPATLADAEAIARVHVESSEDAYAPLAATWDAPGVSQRTASWHKWLTAAQSDTERTDLIAEQGRELVGFITAGPARRKDVDSEAEVYVIHVLPGQRGRGVGGRLWSRACDAARKGTTRSMYVATFAELRCSSFYEARGGKLVQREPGTFNGGEVTKVVYRWAPGQPAER